MKFVKYYWNASPTNVKRPLTLVEKAKAARKTLSMFKRASGITPPTQNIVSHIYKATSWYPKYPRHEVVKVEREIAEYD